MKRVLAVLFILPGALMARVIRFLVRILAHIAGYVEGVYWRGVRNRRMRRR